MNPLPRHILRKLLADYGLTLLDEPERVNAFLADLCGEYRRERYLIVQAMRGRVPADLIAQPQGVATIGPRLSRRLQEQYGLSVEAAQWAVESWAIALNIEELPVQDGGIPAKDDEPTDREILVAFYHATNGAKWRSSRNWLSDAPLDTWYGVTTCSSGRVVGLNITYAQISGFIPPQIANLSNLTELNLSRNQLSGSIPPQLANLSNLTELNLSGNQFSGPIPPQIANLSNLTKLNLSGNQFSGPTPPQIASLSNLTELNLSGNQFDGPIPPQIASLSNLTKLNLSGNQFDGPIPPQIASLSPI